MPKSSKRALTRLIDEDVGRLDVAMDDEVAVRIGDRVADFEKQPQPRGEIGTGAPAPGVDRLAIDIFDRHERPPVGGNAAVDQAREARMIEPGKQLALPLEKSFAFGGLDAQQLERHPLLEPAGRAVAEIDLAHAAATDQALDRERADRVALASELRGGAASSATRPGWPPSRMPASVDRGQHGANLRDDVGGLGRGVQPALLLGNRKIDQSIEQTLDLRPSRCLRHRHKHVPPPLGNAFIAVTERPYRPRRTRSMTSHPRRDPKYGFVTD